MMSRWGQVWGQGKISSSDLDPDLLIWGMRRQVDRGRLPSGVFVIQFEFSGLPKAHQKRRYWWLVSRRPHLDVCLKNPGYAVDVTIAADLGSFTKVCMGHWGLREAGASIRIDGSKKAVALTRDLLGLHGEPTIKAFSYAEAPPRRTPVAGSRV
jgi:hypothetical protein